MYELRGRGFGRAFLIAQKNELPCPRSARGEARPFNPHAFVLWREEPVRAVRFGTHQNVTDTLASSTRSS